MLQLNPYLSFKGNCKEAMTFYKEGLGGELLMSTFADSPIPVSEAQKDQVIHAHLRSESFILMASDTMGDHQVTNGNSVSISVNCDTMESIEKLFAHFSQGGQVIMPLENTFWGARFGMLVDKFGINWMFNHELKK